jgi:protease-4
MGCQDDAYLFPAFQNSSYTATCIAILKPAEILVMYAMSAMCSSRRKLFVSFICLLSAAFAGLAPGDEKGEKKSTESKKATQATVASVTIKGSLPESAGAAGIFGELEVNLSDLVGRLDKAANDKDISAVVLKIRGPNVGPAKLREVRDGIARLRKSGKKVTAELESATTPDYLIACACDEVVMPESGEIMIPGVRAEVMFYRGLFDMLGIQADMMQVGDFKGAAEPYTRREMSPEFRAQYEALLGDLYDQTVEMIATDRKLEPAKVRELIDTGVFTAEAAKEAGLVDVIAYSDELKPRLQKMLAVDKIDLSENYGKKNMNTDFSGMTGMFELFNLMMGVKPVQRTSSAKKIAVVYATGMIMPGESSASLFGGETLGSDTLIKAIREAAADKSVVAIVLRVDSPGGSALASDLIWRAIQKCEKPVVASMGDVAASGGYYISMGCDKIYAEPGTITGSIGVVGGKIVLKGLFDKVGLSTDVISRGKNSGILSETSGFSESERVVWKKKMEGIYKQFVSKAAAGRKMEVAKLESLAGGRIWSGRQAKAKGLVDELGTLKDAISEAKKLAGLSADEKVEQITLPKPRNFLDQLFESELGVQTMFGKQAGVNPEILKRLAEVERVQELFRERTLFLMPHRIEIR